MQNSVSIQNTTYSICLKTELFEDDKNLWALLLNYAIHEFNTKKQFILSVDDILDQWQPTSCAKNEAALKEALIRLGTSVHYSIKNSISHTTIKYGFFSLLEAVYILNNICYYTFSERCKKYLSEFNDGTPMQSFLINQGLCTSPLLNS